MSNEARQLMDQSRELATRARAICDHSNHRHDWDSDGPGYTCNDCGQYGYGPCGFCVIEQVAVNHSKTQAE